MNSALLLLERIAAGVLIAVILAIGWIIAAAWKAPWIRLPSEAAEVIVVLVLLTLGLILVSVVALAQTRKGAE